MVSFRFDHKYVKAFYWLTLYIWNWNRIKYTRRQVAGVSEHIGGTPGMGLGAKPPKCRFAPTVKQTAVVTDQLRENFQILILSAVKIYKQCLQTASVS